MDDLPKWLVWTRELQAVAQTGLAFCRNDYDRERYETVRALTARIMAEYSGAPPEFLDKLYAGETGYATPKVDVRGAVFRGGEILLVQELSDGGRWTLPGGWGDIDLTPSENVEREVREEAGLIVKATKLALLVDRDRAGHQPAYPFHIYKLFFLCDAAGETAKKEGETGEARYFPVGALPELSSSRVLPEQIRRLHAHFLDPQLPTEFD
jgi:ADP-ribose pyrophosphatase YjhB (NUDIX family)